jgi:hypothetical protein
MPTSMQNRELAATEAAGVDRELTFKKLLLKKKSLKKHKKGKVRIVHGYSGVCARSAVKTDSAWQRG